jgi:hypothetical protein
LGFIGYRVEPAAGAARIVRIYMECRENSAPDAAAGNAPAITCGDMVDVVFPGVKGPCRLRGVDGVLVLKKFYKLVFSLEERAREHGNDWRGVMQSPEKLLEHLRYTRNARDFSGREVPRAASQHEEMEEPECAQVVEGS